MAGISLFGRRRKRDKQGAPMPIGDEKQTRQNTAKEQPYLMPGTPEYEERVEDLKMHDPFRPDDAWHEDMEQRNGVHADVMADRHDAVQHAKERVAQRSYDRVLRKEVQFPDVKQEAMSVAQRTEDPVDDRKAERMMPRSLDNITYDDGVIPDEYLPKALSKYM